MHDMLGEKKLAIVTLCDICIVSVQSVRSFHTLGMHIDPAPEEQEIPVIEEPEDPEPELQQEEHPQAAPDFTAEEANPSEEGRQALHSPSKL